MLRGSIIIHTLRFTVGFIGLGNMGARMAGNLLKHGHQLVVFDTNATAATALKTKGAAVATSPAEVAANSDAVVTMLPSSPHTRSVYAGEGGIFSSVRENTLLIDASTIDPSVAREVAAAASAKGAQMVDAPVSGGITGAEAGTLTFMVGGSAEAFSRAEPLLKCMGKNIVHCGDAGSGQVVKVCNNLVLGISMIGISEAMNLGVKLGMDPKVLVATYQHSHVQVLSKIFSTSSASCWANNAYNPHPGVVENVPSSRNYEGGFMSDLMKKDLGLALEAGQSAKTPLVMGGIAYQVYQLLSAHGLGGKDFSVVYKYLQEQAAKKE